MRELTVKLTEDYQPTFDGYEWGGGCQGSLGFRVDILNSNGAPEKSYFWQYYRIGEELEVYETVEGWFKLNGQELIPLTDADLDEKLDAGSGFWILGNGNSLVAAGEVSKDDIEFVTKPSNNTCCGNGTPCELTLGQLSVKLTDAYQPTFDGYEWGGGCQGSLGFRVDILNANGAPEKSYFWQYFRIGEELEVYETVQGWFKLVGQELVQFTQQELDNEKIPAGLSF